MMRFRIVEHRRRDGQSSAHGITAQQYNVLRILRGAGADGWPTLAIGERMLERSPGITRMIDRLEMKGLVQRERRADDRRCVDCRITAAGLRLLAELDEPIDQSDAAAFAALNRGEVRQLISLLERVQPHDSVCIENQREQGLSVDAFLHRRLASVPYVSGGNARRRMLRDSANTIPSSPSAS